MVVEYELIKKQMEEELKTINEVIQKRKDEALEKGIFDKIYKIVHSLGEYSSYGGGEYRYSDIESDLHLEFSSHYDSCRASLGSNDKEVFYAKKIARVEDIFYIPGDWESRLDDLIEKSAIRNQEIELERLQEKIDYLKKEWMLETILPENLWKNNDNCPVCGENVNPEIKACETGYSYCSEECATQHVNENIPEGGY